MKFNKETKLIKCFRQFCGTWRERFPLVCVDDVTWIWQRRDLSAAGNYVLWQTRSRQKAWRAFILLGLFPAADRTQRYTWNTQLSAGLLVALPVRTSSVACSSERSASRDKITKQLNFTRVHCFHSTDCLEKILVFESAQFFQCGFPGDRTARSWFKVHAACGGHRQRTRDRSLRGQLYRSETESRTLLRYRIHEQAEKRQSSTHPNCPWMSPGYPAFSANGNAASTQTEKREYTERKLLVMQIFVVLWCNSRNSKLRKKNLLWNIWRKCRFFWKKTKCIRSNNKQQRRKDGKQKKREKRQATIARQAWNTERAHKQLCTFLWPSWTVTVFWITQSESFISLPKWADHFPHPFVLRN